MRETETKLNWGEGRGHRCGGLCVWVGNYIVMLEQLGRRGMRFGY